MQIKQVGITRNHFQPGDAGRIRMVVMHSTAARGPGDYNYLRQGGSDQRPVSVHFYIDKAGNVSQMVPDKDIAWHAGVSSWPVDGRVVNGCNLVSVGIELENLNTGRDPYPQAQYNAALELVRFLVAKYRVPRRQLVRHLDIAPRRKTDPAGFPWERFVAQVYGPAPSVPATPPPPAPTPEPLPGPLQLRKLLVDLAYRAAGSAHAAGWPLLKEAVSKATGMPSLAISPPPAGDGQGEDEQNRAVTIAGQQLILEAYGRDLFYAAPDGLDQVKRLSETPPSPLRDALLQALFQASDPAKGFRPDQAFHQFYLGHMTEIGVPLGPDHVLPGGKVSCQHYALDTLIWTGKVTRLSELTSAMYAGDPHQQWEKDLRTLVLNDLYNARTGRNFDPNALFCKYAIGHGMGAPTAKAEIQILDGQRLVAMPYALDVLYCRIPGDGDWRSVVIGEIPNVLGDEEDGLARLSTLLAQGDTDEEAPAVLGDEPSIEDILPERIYTGGLLGVEIEAPPIADLTESIGAGADRGGAAIDLLVVYPTVGPSSDDISEAARPGATVWHYYVDRMGALLRLVAEAQAARAAGDAAWQGQKNVDQRSIAVAVESAAGSAMSEEQAAALGWLLHDLADRYALARGQIIQGADLGLSVAIEGWEEVLS
ncbi:MAG: N-acetylmuramoyl-L-alanine amidase [Roseiflexaceae bacterium]